MDLTNENILAPWWRFFARTRNFSCFVVRFQRLYFMSLKRCCLILLPSVFFFYYTLLRLHRILNQRFPNNRDLQRKYLIFTTAQ